MTIYYFIRHGEPEWELNEERKLRGARRDFVPLTEKGVLQSEITAKDKCLKKGEIIISSPYTRALHTAAIIARELHLPLYVEYDLHEWIPDLTFQYDMEQLRQLHREYDECHGIYPEGKTCLWESKQSMRARVSSVLQKYLFYSCVIVVCHGMVIRSQVDVKDIAHAAIIEYNLLTS